MRWKDEHAIIAKLAWHAMDVDGNPSWAVILSGKIYMIVHILYCTDSNKHLRSVLRYSQTIPVFDSSLPIWSALLYMVASVQFNGARLLQDTLKISVNGNLPCHGPSKTRRCGLTSPSTENSDGLLVYTEDSFAICMPRASDLSSPLPEPTVSFEILLTGKPRQGGSGHVYRTATRYVLKLANGTQASKQMLLDELKWYDVLASAGIQAVSRCHGLFRSGNDIALVLDDKGEELLDFDGLDSDQRKHLYWSLCSIHRAGVTHGDFEPRNVVVQADPWQSSTFLILGITNVKEKMLAQS